MMKNRFRHLLVGVTLLSLFLGLSVAQPTSAYSQEPSPDEPVVQAVLFWMEGCPHCHTVIDQILPVLELQYGEKLSVELVELVDLDQIDGLYRLAEDFGIPRNATGVPLLVVGEYALVGPDQIRAEFPGIIEAYLGEGGMSLSDRDALQALLPQQVGEPEICDPVLPCEEDLPPAIEPQTGQMIVASEIPINDSSAGGNFSPLVIAAGGIGLVVLIVYALFTRKH
jgi:hypothetical protein